MKQMISWDEVAAQAEVLLGDGRSDVGRRLALIEGQRESLRALCARLRNNGVILADEVGMGKTRIAVALAHCVIAAGGRVVVVAPPGLDEQWRREFALVGRQPPALLRSYWQFLQAWDGSDTERPWLQEKLVLVSHSFNRWAPGKLARYRWSLLPATLARYRKDVLGKRWPNGYGEFEQELADCVSRAAGAIIGNLSMVGSASPSGTLLQDIHEALPAWSEAANGENHAARGVLRRAVDQVTGLGLGAFDLVIIDEAHKSRNEESLLSTLLDDVLLRSGSARCLAMSATPVELDASQWEQSLRRIGVAKPPVDVIKKYVASVDDLRRSPLNAEYEQAYLAAAAAYRDALDPYLLRRDKREDPTVQRFSKHATPAGQDYREVRPIKVRMDPVTISEPWMRAVCAAEALSFASTRVLDNRAKRHRLTVGNGHGISGLIDAVKEETSLQPEISSSALDDATALDDAAASGKRKARTEWWHRAMQRAVREAAPGNGAPYTHPALLAAVDAIESVTVNEKVLVFGHYRAPMNALQNLLNARAMLRALDEGKVWPQSGLHSHEDRVALQVAHRQLFHREADLEAVEQKLQSGYRELENSRQRFRTGLLRKLKEGFTSLDPLLGARFTVPLQMLEDEHPSSSDASSAVGALAVVARALADHLEGEAEDPTPVQLATAFVELMQAAANLDPLTDDADGSIDDASRGENTWSETLERFREDYSYRQGGFARQLNGDTAPGTRRLLQLAFNRANANPKVLIAQSQVGREGLNLHLACRTVVLLHLEWNPAVVEQQIGRVDRMGSLWQQLLERAIECPGSTEPMPRIQVRPVVFEGTYDERQWRVLQYRWQTLRSQLHGEILPECDPEDVLGAQLRERVAAAAPCFSPTQPRR